VHVGQLARGKSRGDRGREGGREEEAGKKKMMRYIHLQALYLIV